jgi:hypothetical protein
MPVDLNKLLKGFVVSLISVLFFQNCTKIKTTDIGNDLLPAVDNVSTFDTTLEVITTNYLFGDSAVPVLGYDLAGRTPDHVLGYISDDPQFGRTTGSIFLELKPPFYKYYFENTADSLFLDSVVLCLKWTNTWGDTNAVQKIDVFECRNYIRGDSSYNTNASVRYSGQLGTRTFAPSILNDSLVLLEQRLNNQLRIRLDDEFGKRLLAQDSAEGKPYNSDSSFRDFFKGFALVPDEAGGPQANALMSFSLSDTNTYLRLYYRYIKNGVLDTTNRKFVLNNGIPGGHVNNIKRDYSGSQIEAHLNPPPGGDSLVYLQVSPGSYAIVRLSALEGFKASKGNVMVHLAELGMQQAEAPPAENNNYLIVPNYLTLDYRDTVNNRQVPFLYDAFLSGTYTPLVFGGIPKPIVGPTGQVVSEFKFAITRYVQGIITRNEPNFPIYLYAPYTVTYKELLLSYGLNNVARGRVKVGGGKHNSQKMKLRIIYSKI